MSIRLTPAQQRFRADATQMFNLAEDILTSSLDNHLYKKVLLGARMEQGAVANPRNATLVLNQLLNETSDSDLARLINYYLGKQRGR